MLFLGTDTKCALLRNLTTLNFNLHISSHLKSTAGSTSLWERLLQGKICSYLSNYKACVHCWPSLHVKKERKEGCIIVHDSSTHAAGFLGSSSGRRWKMGLELLGLCVCLLWVQAGYFCPCWVTCLFNPFRCQTVSAWRTWKKQKW